MYLKCLNMMSTILQNRNSLTFTPISEQKTTITL
jgi:hypothetical protein